MAYSSTNPLALLMDGFASNMPRVFSYQSTHASTDVTVTGFFTGVGENSRGLSALGLRLGDVIMNRASTDAAIPGRVTMHSVISATANVLSTSASSGYAAAYNVTVASAT